MRNVHDAGKLQTNTAPMSTIIPHSPGFGFAGLALSWLSIGIRKDFDVVSRFIRFPVCCCCLLPVTASFLELQSEACSYYALLSATVASQSFFYP